MKRMTILLLASPMALAFGVMAQAQEADTVTGSFAPEEIRVEVLPPVPNVGGPLSVDELRVLLDAAIAREEAEKIDPNYGDKDTIKEGEKPEEIKPLEDTFKPAEEDEDKPRGRHLDHEKWRDIREHHNRRVENMFTNIDRDGNGELTMSEFARGARILLEVHNLMQAPAADGHADHRQRQNALADQIGAAFSVGDHNKDGVISKREFERGQGFMLQALHLTPGEELREARERFHLMMEERMQMRTQNDDQQTGEQTQEDDKPRHHFRDGTPRR